MIIEKWREMQSDENRDFMQETKINEINKDEYVYKKRSCIISNYELKYAKNRKLKKGIKMTNRQNELWNRYLEVITKSKKKSYDKEKIIMKPLYIHEFFCSLSDRPIG